MGKRVIAFVDGGVLLLLLLFGLGPPVSWGAQQELPTFSTPKAIEPNNVYALAQLIDKEIESLRYIMGVNKVTETLFHVENAKPREVYFQAVNLYGKTIRLRHNLTARSIPDHDLPTVGQHIWPADVWAVLTVVLSHIHEIQEEYNITSHAVFPPIEENKAPSDVYQSLLLTIRQLNQMLQQQPYTHSDVYQEVTNSLYCLLNIYTTFPGLQMERQPALQPGKTAGDVFVELIDTYQTVREVMQLSGFTMLELSVIPPRNIKPGDIYELAVLITSELKFLHSKLAPEKTLHNAAYPGIKFPSQVLQRLTYLHNHLQAIEQKVKKNPDWINQLSL